jgi:hypothetical protein
MTDDGFNIGVLYAGDRKPYPTLATKPQRASSELEADFEL